jgi:hypothetical protein
VWSQIPAYGSNVGAAVSIIGLSVYNPVAVLPAPGLSLGVAVSHISLHTIGLNVGKCEVADGCRTAGTLGLFSARSTNKAGASRVRRAV